MPSTQRSSGVTVDHPSTYRVAAKRATSRGAPPFAPGKSAVPRSMSDRAGEADAMAGLLARQGLELVDTIDLDTVAEATRDDGRRRRGAARVASSQAVRFSVEVDENEGAVMLVEQDGIYSWVMPRASGRKSAAAERRGPAESSARFDLTIRSTAAAGARRGDASGGMIFRGIRANIFKFAAGKTADALVKLLERNLERGVVRIEETDPMTWQTGEDLSFLRQPEGRQARVLLLIHGTFSTTLGSYGHLGLTDWGRRLLKDAFRTYDAVIGVDHPTLSESPEENAADIFRRLQAGPRTPPPRFDCVAYSRGGLVLRTLIERLAARSSWSSAFERAVLVAATNRGTRLAEPDNWESLLNFYTNLAMGSTRLLGAVTGSPLVTAVAGGAISSLGGFARYLAIAGTDEQHIPGLAAMEPDGEFVRLLNRNRPDPGRYLMVSSNYESERGGEEVGLPRRLATKAFDRVADRLMGVANDLVVDVDSMNFDAPPENRLDFGTNGDVYHLVYFAQPDVVGFLSERLLGRKRKTARRGALRLAAEPEVERLPETAERRRKAAPPRIPVEVFWGDIVAAPGDVVAVGHYQGVPPQNAEWALDRAISGYPEDDKKGILAQQTRDGLLRGGLGEINRFPWPRRKGVKTPKYLAVAGMGRPGRFDEASLRRLAANLVISLSALPRTGTLSTVLIGSGEGTLTIEGSIKGFLEGVAEAVASGKGKVKKIQIVEIWRSRAQQVWDAVKSLEGSEVMELDLEPRIGELDGGRIDWEYGIAALIDAAAVAGEGTQAGLALDRLLKNRRLGLRKGDRQAILGAISHMHEWSGGDLPGVISRLGIHSPWGRSGEDVSSATRISLAVEGTVVRASAITSTATIAERIIGFDPSLVTEAGRRMTDPFPEDVGRLSSVLTGLLMPRDFRQLLEGAAPLVVEVDRQMAQVHWEMLSSVLESDGRPLGLDRPVARQLRTTYSPAPSLEKRSAKKLRALVVGDPGDPAKSHSLPGARREALGVIEMLEKHGLEVVAMIGAPDHNGIGPEPPHRAATRFDLLELLMLHEPFDILHYSGHGDFDPDDPTNRSGWLFQDGFLTARQIEAVDRVPSLIFANACLSGKTSLRSGGGDIGAPYGEYDLLPSLADQFFAQGARDYIGTAWKVDDEGAIEFARTFYGKFLAGGTLGTALLEARKKLSRATEKYDALWAAYQHYGDPTFDRGDFLAAGLPWGMDDGSAG